MQIICTENTSKHLNMVNFAKNIASMLYIKKENDIPDDYSFRDYLKKFLSDHSVSPEAAAKLIKVSRPTLEKYLNGGEWDIKASNILPLSVLMDVNVADILDSIERDKESVNNSTESLRSCAYVISNFDTSGLKDIGVLKKRTTIESFAGQISSFLGLNNILEYDNLISASSLFSKSKRSIEETKKQHMTEFLIKTSVIMFDSIDNPFEYREDILKLFLSGRIRPFTLDIVDGFSQTIKALFKMGITVIVLPYVHNTGIFGCSMIRNGKPCIILTDQGKKYHKLWMTLVHELYHILHDWDLLESTAIHMSDEHQLDVLYNEEAADDFASTVFVPTPVIDLSRKKINIPYIIEATAQKMQIHSSILYGICFEWYNRKDKIKILNNYNVLISSAQTVTNVCFDPFKQKTLAIAVKKLKETIYKISV